MDGIDAGGRGWTCSLPNGMSGTGATDAEPFYEILKAELPKKVIRSYTGTKLVFSA